MPKNETAPSIKVTIDGKELQGRLGQTILEIANENEVYIPTLCYLKQLSPVGACRMCIVEVEGMRKIVTSCTTPATDGMSVKTGTDKLKTMRRVILELLFSERNHICPFCEVSGGDCELQNAAYKYNMDHIRYPYLFPDLETDTSHPFFMLDHNRCILCSRCIRYCDEIEGVHTLDFGFRGKNNMVIVDLHKTFENSTCTSCGGCVQVCPTGALVNKISAFRGKQSDCTVTSTICQQCSLGCGISVYSRGNHLVNIDGDELSEVNKGHLCVTGRFEPLVSNKTRIEKPAVVHKGSSVEFSWEKALDHVSYKLKRLKQQNPNSIYAYISPKMTNEAVYRFMKFFRETIGTKNAFVLGSYEYDSYAKALEKPNMEYSVLNLESDMSRLDESDCIVVLGADPGVTHKVLAAKIRSRIRQQKAKLIIVNDNKSQLDDMSDIAIQVNEGTDGLLLNSLIYLELTSPSSKQQIELPYSLREEFAQFAPELIEAKVGVSWDKIVQISKMISRSKNPFFVFGRGLSKQNNPEIFQTLINLIRQVGKIENGKLPLIGIRKNSNARGSFVIDMMTRPATQDDYGVNLLEKVDPEECKFLFLAIGDDEIQLLDNDIMKLSQVEFLVAQNSFPSQVVDFAEVILPSPVWYEKAGTMANSQGQMQTLSPVFTPDSESVRQEWEVFAEMENRFSKKQVTPNLEAIQKEMNEKLSKYRANFAAINVEALPFRCIQFSVPEGGK